MLRAITRMRNFCRLYHSCNEHSSAMSLFSTVYPSKLYIVLPYNQVLNSLTFLRLARYVPNVDNVAKSSI